MNKWLVLAGAYVLLGGVSGCGGDPHADLVKRMIAEIDKAADILEEIKNAKDPTEAAKNEAKELQKVGEKLKELKAQVEALKEPLDPEDKERLAEEYRAKFQKAMDRASKAWDSVKDIKGVRRELKDALGNFGFPG
jgi:hypothetical protein